MIMKKNWKIIALLLTLSSGLVVAWCFLTAKRPLDQVVMSLGDTYAQIEKASSYKMLHASDSSGAWSALGDEPFMLHFNDSQFAFSTSSSFLYIVGEHNQARSLRMSPQTKTLPLEEMLKVALDLEKQLKNGGWKICSPNELPAYGDMPDIAKKLAERKNPNVFWRAGDKYMLNYNTRLFSSANFFHNDLYLMTISMGMNISQPCITPEEDTPDTEIPRKVTFKSNGT